MGLLDEMANLVNKTFGEKDVRNAGYNVGNGWQCLLLL